MKKYLLTGLVLAIFSVICALILSVVNYFTAPVIDEANQKKISESVALILNVEEVDAPSFVSSYDVNTSYTSLKEASNDKKWKSSSVKVRDSYKATVDGKEYVFYLIDTKGFASTIQIMVGVDSEYKLVGSKVISQSETKGDVSKHDFKVNGESTLANFDKLSGSTFSSMAVKRAYAVALDAAKTDLGGNK